MIMMSFCKRSVHSFLGTTTNDNNVTLLKPPPLPLPPPPRRRNIQSPVDGLSLIAVTCNNNTLKPSNNVLESSTIIKSTDGGSGSVSGFDIGVGNAKKESGGFGFIDDIGGGVDGLMSCTESLGFESSDERRTDDQLDQLLRLNEEIRESEMCTTSQRNNQWRKRMKVRSEPRSFPPPLSSLKQNGQPSFYLRPVRKDGRLELTEVRIDRAEVLHASRHDGRLRLHLIRDEIDEDEEEEEEIEDEQIEELEKVEDEIESVGEWKLPAVTNAGGGDGFRRCYELVNHHHHNHHPHSNLHVWSQQHCVTTG